MLSSDFHIKLADTLGFKEDYEKRLIDVNNRDLELKVRFVSSQTSKKHFIRLDC